jgi:UMF1 family MFS transporter
MSQNSTRSAWSWATYDWANSAFSTTVMAGFFPLFFKQYWSADLSATDSTFYLGTGNAIASLVIVLTAPVLGAMADHGGIRKRMLAAFACTGAAATGALFLVAHGMWPAALLLYAVAVIGFSGANVFYDALLVDVAAKSNRHKISALGYSLGYLGGGLLFLLNVMMTLKPHWFGLADAAQAVRWSFLSVAIWWLAFSLPLLLHVREGPPSGNSAASGIANAFKAVFRTAKKITRHRQVGWFLLAYFLYIDAVHTIIRMAVDYGLSIGLDSNGLIVALLLVQFIGFPAALVFGKIGQKMGARAGIWITLWVYVAVTLFATVISTPVHFYIVAVMIGLVQGGVQALSRSLYSQLIPESQAAEFFGFYGMIGKSAAVAGPLLVGITASVTDNPRLAILSILILLVAGMLLFTKVQEPE